MTSLIWKPFEARFGEILDRMTEHRRFVWQQLIIWHASESSKEIAKAAAERDIATEEREDAAHERKLAQQERILMREELEERSSQVQHVSGLLTDIRSQMRLLEDARKGWSHILSQSRSHVTYHSD